MLYWLDATSHQLAHRLQRILVSDVARHSRHGTALFFSLIVGPRMIARAVALPDRPGGARRRPEVASAQGRHADDGRRADPGRHPGRDAAVGGPLQPLHLDRARGDLRLRPDRFLRRLPEAGGRQLEGPGGALEVSLAVARRPRRRGSALLHRREPRRRPRCSCRSSSSSPRRSRRSATSPSRT